MNIDNFINIIMHECGFLIFSINFQLTNFINLDFAQLYPKHFFIPIAKSSGEFSRLSYSSMVQDCPYLGLRLSA